VDDLEETIEASLKSMRVEQREAGKGHYQPFVGLKQSQLYKGECKEIREFLKSLKRPEGKNPKGNAAVPTRSYNISRFGWNYLPEVQNQRTSSKGISEWGSKEKSNGSHT
jgi:hypothetical protein